MQQRVVPVRVREGYSVVIGSDLLAHSGRLLRETLGNCRLAVVSDSNVAKLYLPAVLESLEQAGFDACSYVFPAGEANKRLGTLSGMLEFFADERITRTDCVVALGGGVTGDMAGFAAGCYLRGVSMCNCRPRCWPRWIPPSAERRRSIWRRAKTSRGYFISLRW